MRHLNHITRQLPAKAQTTYEPPLPYYMTDAFKESWGIFWNTWVLVTDGLLSVATALAPKLV